MTTPPSAPLLDLMRQEVPNAASLGVVTPDVALGAASTPAPGADFQGLAARIRTTLADHFASCPECRRAAS